MLQPGSIFDDKYEIHGILGHGGMGAVYKATHLELKHSVALKVMHDKHAIDEESIKRFVREAKTLARLQHKNIVKFFNFGISNGVYYTSMEYLPGKSLSSLLLEEGALPPARALRILLQICQGLSFAHANGIFHRDMKPGNVVVLNEKEEDNAKIFDFGLAKLTTSSGLLTRRLTKTGLLVGSVHYMSPEQIMGKPIDARADVYSCGCILYEMITGNKPFDADSAVGVMYKHSNDPVPPFSSTAHGKDCPKAVENICVKAMAKIPASRYQTMEDLISDLKVAISGQGQLLASVDRSSSSGPAANPRVKASVDGGSFDWRKFLRSPAGFLAAALVLAIVSFPIFSYRATDSSSTPGPLQQNEAERANNTSSDRANNSASDSSNDTATVRKAESNGMNRSSWAALNPRPKPDPTNTLSETIEDRVKLKRKEAKEILESDRSKTLDHMASERLKERQNKKTIQIEKNMRLTPWTDAVYSIEQELGGIYASKDPGLRKDENSSTGKWTAEQQNIAYKVYLEQKAKQDAILQAAQYRINANEFGRLIRREKEKVRLYSEQLKSLALTPLPLESVNRVIIQNCPFVEIIVDPNTSPKILVNFGIELNGSDTGNVVNGNTLFLKNYRMPLQVYLKDLSALKSNGLGTVYARGLHSKNIVLELEGKGTMLAEGRADKAQIIALDTGTLILEDLIVGSEASVAAKLGKVCLDSPKVLNTFASSDSQLFRRLPATLTFSGKKPELLAPN